MITLLQGAIIAMALLGYISPVMALTCYGLLGLGVVGAMVYAIALDQAGIEGTEGS